MTAMWELFFDLRIFIITLPHELIFWDGKVASIVDQNLIAETVVPAADYDTSEWHENLYDPTLADAICDRIIYNAYTIQIEGESMRKR